MCYRADSPRTDSVIGTNTPRVIPICKNYVYLDILVAIYFLNYNSATVLITVGQLLATEHRTEPQQCA